ncbi:hypothetical protein A2U01_0108222, partial [Trifolium medium]|nr:hypothetical protein [Trifolium medium]
LGWWLGPGGIDSANAEVDFLLID